MLNESVSLSLCSRLLQQPHGTHPPIVTAQLPPTRQQYTATRVVASPSAAPNPSPSAAPNNTSTAAHLVSTAVHRRIGCKSCAVDECERFVADPSDPKNCTCGHPAHKHVQAEFNVTCKSCPPHECERFVTDPNKPTHCTCGHPGHRHVQVDSNAPPHPVQPSSSQPQPMQLTQWPSASVMNPMASAAVPSSMFGSFNPPYMHLMQAHSRQQELTASSFEAINDAVMTAVKTASQSAKAYAAGVSQVHPFMHPYAFGRPY